MAYDHRKQKKVTLLTKRDDLKIEPLIQDKPKLEQTLEVRITSAFTTMREDLEGTAREANAYADKIIGLLDQLEELHLRKHAGFQIIKENSDMNKEKFDCMFSTYFSLLNELAPCRMQVIQSGEEATQVQSVQMRKSRKDTMDAAKRRLDEGREKQQLVTDASEFMKHYKALIMAA